MPIEVISYQEWVAESDLVSVRRNRISQFAKAFPEIAGADLARALPRQGRRGGLFLYHGAVRTAAMVVRDVAVDLGDRIGRAALRMEEAADAYRQRSLWVELRLPAVVDVRLFEFHCPPIKGCQVDVSVASGQSAERIWTVSSVGVARGRRRAVSVGMESTWPIGKGRRCAIMARMLGYTVYALYAGRPQPVRVELTARDETHALWLDDLPTDSPWPLGTFLKTFRGPINHTYTFQESGETTIRYSGEFRAMEGVAGATLAMESGLRLSFSLAAGRTYHLHRTPTGNGVGWRIE